MVSGERAEKQDCVSVVSHGLRHSLQKRPKQNPLAYYLAVNHVWIHLIRQLYWLTSRLWYLSNPFFA